MVLGAVITAFVVAAVPALVFMAIWAAVTAMRILRPDRSLPFVSDPVTARREATARGESMPVHFREIHEDLQLHTKELARQVDLVGGHVHRVPDAWLDDLYRRRN